MNKENYISLYDHLGKAAGAELGKQVNEYAKIRNQPHKVRYVENPGYAGYVNLYTKEFLQEFFQTKYVLTNEQ
jgi:CTP:phosphocholine cytidylyltransferase-like protein